MQACRLIIFCLVLGLSASFVCAQTLTVSQVNPIRATVNEIVTISGVGFGNDAAQLSVRFGSVQGEIVAVNDNSVRVKVPAGATTGSISVTRLDNYLTAFSPETFYLSFDGDSFETTHLDGPYRFSTSDNDLYNLCLCDFNNDGKVDIATSDTENDRVTVLENTSQSIDTVSFLPREFDLSAKTRWVRCGDLNGDGLPELIYSASNADANKERIYLYENISNPAPGSEIRFDESTPVTSLTLDGTLSARMDLKDMDGDGKPELVAVSISREGGISIFRNTSSEGNLNFDPNPMLPFQQFDVNNVELS